MPNRQPQRAAAALLGNFGQGAHLLGRQSAHRDGDAEIEQPGLALRMHAEMRAFDGRLARHAAFQRKPLRLERKMFFRLGEETVQPQAFQHIFEPRLLAVGAIAVIDEAPHQGERYRRAFLRSDQQPGVAREIAVPGDAAEQDPEIDAGRDGLALADRDRRKADVVGVLEHRNRAAAVEPHVELARQAV